MSEYCLVFWRLGITFSWQQPSENKSQRERSKNLIESRLHQMNYYSCLQKYPKYNGTLVHERHLSRSNRFTNKHSERKSLGLQTVSQATNTQADDNVCDCEGGGNVFKG